MDFTIRQVNNDDLIQLSQLFNDYREFYGQEEDVVGCLEFLRARQRNNESTIFIATDNEHILGFVQLYPIFSSVNLSRALLLNDLYVAPQSRKEGIASALIDAVTTFAKKKHASWVMLQTQHTNTDAQSLYEKLGFKLDLDCRYYYLSTSD
ncbi:GNAT family N-acetyltransferase [Aestuariibacter sp. AA17]|uniref:GNAT family N-acetyltransferase n=1 Tax=Fluctibacter corallii TaxID=2984329 RepID=A0ABT3AB82_9ALTE|nr:GNAT family N-acetyltransferase [Aestuariibacter sp. AA17]MCV2885864.1 GNAT family N-acetyltransferase [Aestuariibacter sp. AA17]